MPIIACDSCGHEWLLKADRLGQRVKCPKCKARVQTEAPPKRKLPVAVIMAAAIGVLVLTTGALLTAVLLFGGRKPSDGGGDEAALDITRAPKVVKTGDAPDGSPFETARGDTGPWKVQPQSEEPAKDQLSLFAWPIDLEAAFQYPTDILFGDPASRTAGVLLGQHPRPKKKSMLPVVRLHRDLLGNVSACRSRYVVAKHALR